MRFSPPPGSDRRRAISIRLAVLLGLVAFAFYMAMFMLGGVGT